VEARAGEEEGDPLLEAAAALGEAELEEHREAALEALALPALPLPLALPSLEGEGEGEPLGCREPEAGLLAEAGPEAAEQEEGEGEALGEAALLAELLLLPLGSQVAGALAPALPLGTAVPRALAPALLLCC